MYDVFVCFVLFCRMNDRVYDFSPIRSLVNIAVNNGSVTYLFTGQSGVRVPESLGIVKGFFTSKNYFFFMFTMQRSNA